MKKTTLTVLLLAAACVGTTGAFNGGKAFAAEDVKTSAKAAYVIDFDSGTVIYKHNENEKLPIASMSKIMTALLCFEAADEGRLSYDELITVSPESADMGGSQIFLDANSRHKAKDLLKSIVVASANDSCHAMAERLCGSESGFVNAMNGRAKELGMTNTVFANCTGLPAVNQHSTAKDVTAMMRELLKHDEYFELCKVWLEDYVHPDGRTTTMTNTNKLIRFYKGCDGGKTGFTVESMFCLSASAKRGDMRVIATVIGEPSSKIRFKDVSNMFNYAFGNYENKVVYAENEPVDCEVAVKNGKIKTFNPIPERNVAAFGKRGDESGITVNFELDGELKAPLKKGEVIGKAVVLKNGKVADEVPLLVPYDVEKAGIFDIIRRITEKW